MTEPEAVHYEVEYSPTGEPPWFLVCTASSDTEAVRLAKDWLGAVPPLRTRIRRVVAAKSAEVVETYGGESE